VNIPLEVTIRKIDNKINKLLTMTRQYINLSPTPEKYCSRLQVPSFELIVSILDYLLANLKNIEKSFPLGTGKLEDNQKILARSENDLSVYRVE